MGKKIPAGSESGNKNKTLKKSGRLLHEIGEMILAKIKLIQLIAKIIDGFASLSDCLRLIPVITQDQLKNVQADPKIIKRMAMKQRK